MRDFWNYFQLSDYVNSIANRKKLCRFFQNRVLTNQGLSGRNSGIPSVLRLKSHVFKHACQSQNTKHRKMAGSK